MLSEDSNTIHTKVLRFPNHSIRFTWSNYLGLQLRRSSARKCRRKGPSRGVLQGLLCRRTAFIKTENLPKAEGALTGLRAQHIALERSLGT